MAEFSFRFLRWKVIAANRDCVCIWRQSIEMVQQLPGSSSLCSSGHLIWELVSMIFPFHQEISGKFISYSIVILKY
jgi:hypothetical protein